ncbi:MAR-binding filament-like protein 1 isoform X2 [Brachypodium distachyon]|uniref:MAR-binding filament-like protein 1 isoform X2 n=1 Tax=Brachypodium distachyon TaxID=15368 RepID=UPI00052FDE69|nr:MAR-binding filament-like protein 1 isoform X2 [Brachypodium distachyon]|eukprot:XP_010231649.1 MAR-binding filament-like protein 1 isoform X2 [Brachypodium distachyon]
MGYHHLLVVSTPAQPPPPRLSLFSRSPRGAVTASASHDGARLSASAATRRRVVLLVGVSVLPLLRLRDTAAAAHPSAADLVTDRMDFHKTEGMQPEKPLAEPPQPEMEIKLAENEAAMSLLRESYEKRLLDEQAALKKQTRMFQDEEASLLDQLNSTKRTVTSLKEKVIYERELVEQLKHEIYQLENSFAQAEEAKHMLEGKLSEKLEALAILHDKVNLLSQDLNDKEKLIRELSSSLSSKESEYQSLHLIYSQTEGCLEHANSRIEQLEKDVLAAKDDIKSKISLVDSLNEEVQRLYAAKSEAGEKISELTKQYAELGAASEMRASRDSELLFDKDSQFSQLEEKLSSALSDSRKDRAIIAELNIELEANRTVLDNEVEARKSVSDLIQFTEEVLKESRNEVSKLSEELNGVNISNQDLTTQILKFTNESIEVKQALTNKVEEAESVSKALSGELASTREILEKSQEDLEAASNQLVSTTEAHDELNKELLDAYKKLESTTNDLVRERKINATLNRELEAIVKQSLVDSEARRTLQADLNEATISLNEVSESTLLLSNKLGSSNSMISNIREDKKMLSEALVEQKKSTAEAQKNMADAQNLIQSLGVQREKFEMSSKKLEEELATAKGEILCLRRQISAIGSQDPNSLLETSVAPNFSQPSKQQHVNYRTDAGAHRSAKKIYRRKDRPAR